MGDTTALLFVPWHRREHNSDERKASFSSSLSQAQSFWSRLTWINCFSDSLSHRVHQCSPPTVRMRCLSDPGALNGDVPCIPRLYKALPRTLYGQFAETCKKMLTIFLRDFPRRLSRQARDGMILFDVTWSKRRNRFPNLATPALSKQFFQNSLGAGPGDSSRPSGVAGFRSRSEFQSLGS